MARTLLLSALCSFLLSMCLALENGLWKQGDMASKSGQNARSHLDHCAICDGLEGQLLRRCIDRHCSPLGDQDNRCTRFLSLAMDACSNDAQHDVTSAGASSISASKRIWGDPLEVCIGARCAGLRGGHRRMCIFLKCSNS